MQILLALHHELDPNQGAAGVTLALGTAMVKQGCTVDYYGFDQAYPGKVTTGVEESVKFPWRLARFLSSCAKGFDVMDISAGDNWVWAKRGRPGAQHRHLLVTRSHGLEHSMDIGLRQDAKQGVRPLSWKYPIYHGGFRLWEVAASLRYADLNFLLNQHDLTFTEANLKVDRQKLKIVRNGISNTFLNVPLDPISQINEIYIAQIGSYIARKGIAYSVPALAAVLSRHPHVSVSFLGVGSAAEKVLADFAPELRLRVRVTPRYDRNDLPHLLQGHQILLFPSLTEGFGLGLLEGMACGLAPIATAIPGPTEFAQDNTNALLIPPGDSIAIENALEKLIEDAALRNRLRRAAHATAQNFGWDQIARDTLALYEAALAKRHGKQ